MRLDRRLVAGVEPLLERRRGTPPRARRRGPRRRARRRGRRGSRSRARRSSPPPRRRRRRPRRGPGRPPTRSTPKKRSTRRPGGCVRASSARNASVSSARGQSRCSSRRRARAGRRRPSVAVREHEPRRGAGEAERERAVGDRRLLRHAGREVGVVALQPLGGRARDGLDLRARARRRRAGRARAPSRPSRPCGRRASGRARPRRGSASASSAVAQRRLELARARRRRSRSAPARARAAAPRGARNGPFRSVRSPRTSSLPVTTTTARGARSSTRAERGARRRDEHAAGCGAPAATTVLPPSVTTTHVRSARTRARSACRRSRCDLAARERPLEQEPARVASCDAPRRMCRAGRRADSRPWAATRSTLGGSLTGARRRAVSPPPNFQATITSAVSAAIPASASEHDLALEPAVLVDARRRRGAARRRARRADEARVVLVDVELAVEPEEVGVRAEEALDVRLGGKHLELLVLERAQVLRADLRRELGLRKSSPWRTRASRRLLPISNMSSSVEPASISARAAEAARRSRPRWRPRARSRSRATPRQLREPRRPAPPARSSVRSDRPRAPRTKSGRRRCPTRIATGTAHAASSSDEAVLRRESAIAGRDRERRRRRRAGRASDGR